MNADDARVRAAYATRAAEYAGLFGTIEAAAEADRQLLLAWALGVEGRILDVGCGPGHWTHHLHHNGVDIEGVDPVPAFVDHARRSFPGVEYRLGEADQLGVADGSLGGILAWYSLIHTAPERIPALLADLARCTRPGGGLAVGFFEGPELAPFDHAVATAYVWPVEELSARIDQAGFVVTDVHTRTDPGARPHGAIIAQRST